VGFVGVPDPPVVVTNFVLVILEGLAVVDKVPLPVPTAVLFFVKLTALVVPLLVYADEGLTVVDAGVLAGVEEAMPVPEAREAEYEEQRPKPTEAALATSEELQAESRQPVTRFCIFFWPEPHWQATSVAPQPEDAIAGWRQGTAH